MGVSFAETAVSSNYQKELSGESMLDVDDAPLGEASPSSWQWETKTFSPFPFLRLQPEPPVKEEKVSHGVPFVCSMAVSFHAWREEG